MKKVLFIEAAYLKGGIETFILNVAKNIDQKKFELYLLKECEIASIESDFLALGGKIIRITSFSENKIRYLKDLKDIIKKYNFDIIHINKNSLSNPLPIIISKKYKVPKIILHSHNTNPTNGNASIRVHNFFKHKMKKYNLIRLACSEKAAHWMFNDNDQYDIIKNGIDVDDYKYSETSRILKRKELGIDDQLCIVSVGRLSKQKNPFFIIDIFEKILESHKNSLLFMIGTGELESELKSYIVNKNIEKNVKLLGSRNDIDELLQAMDIFLMPSLYEGLPISAIEAQASGLPMLISSTVDNGVILLESTEVEKLESIPEKWAAHLLKLYSKSIRKNTADVLRKSGYDIKNTVHLIETIYSQ